MNDFLKKIGRCLYYKKIFWHNRKDIDFLFSILQDKKSKKTLNCILSAYTAVFFSPHHYHKSASDQMCTEYHFMDKYGYKVFGTPNPYFLNEIYGFPEDTVFFDGGAYIGDTITLFEKITNNKYQFIYAFEPNENNYKKLITSVNANKSGKIKTYNCGLADNDEVVNFVMDDAGSRIASDGKYKTKVIDTGKFLRELTDDYPTFIKLDIEGKETDVIVSMTDYIKQHRPDMAISIYHNLKDLWNIPILLHSICPDYKIYIRHQSNYYTETICYATIEK